MCIYCKLVSETELIIVYPPAGRYWDGGMLLSGCMAVYESVCLFVSTTQSVCHRFFIYVITSGRETDLHKIFKANILNMKATD